MFKIEKTTFTNEYKIGTFIIIGKKNDTHDAIKHDYIYLLSANIFYLFPSPIIKALKLKYYLFPETHSFFKIINQRFTVANFHMER